VAEKKQSDIEKTWDWSETARFEIRLPVDFLETVDDWRRTQAPIPNRSEAIRQLAAIGLRAEERRRK
jgi:metal-responsive CopG/Arc/MetJ family transcriptional regulator